MFNEVKKNFGFGCMRLPMMKDPLNPDKQIVDTAQFSKMIDAFLEAGFNYFDTAHGYLDGLSETAIRECLVKRYPRESYTLTNKLTDTYFNSEEELRSFFQKQLEICGVSYFDFYLMHAQDAKIYEKFKKYKAYETALELKKEGKIKHFGISFHDTADVLDKILSENPEIEVVQIQFNYADLHDTAVQSLKVYEVCEKYGKPVIVMEPVKGGNLVDLHESVQKIIDDFREKRGVKDSNASFAIRFAASYPSIFMTLSGVSTLEQMQDNISFMKDFKPLDDEESHMIEQAANAFNRLAKIPCTRCYYCVRENHCPKKIQIPELFACYNKKKLFNSWNQDFYYTNVLIRDHGRASDCIKCGMCEKTCPQHLPIRALLEDVAKEFDKKENR